MAAAVAGGRPRPSSARARARLFAGVLLVALLFTARNFVAVLFPADPASEAMLLHSGAEEQHHQHIAQPAIVLEEVHSLPDADSSLSSHMVPIDPTPMAQRKSVKDSVRHKVLQNKDVDIGTFTTKASLLMVGAWPTCDYRTVCMTRRNFFIFTPVDDSGTKWNPEMNIMRNCYNGNYSGALTTPAEFWQDRESVVWLPGTTILIDTFLLRNQFGHVGLKLIQSWSLMQSFYPGLISYFLLQPLGKPLGNSGTGQLARELFGEHIDDGRFLTLEEVFDLGAPTVCMARAFRLGRMFEREFADEGDIVRWQSMLALRPSLLPTPHGKCPVPKAVILQRRPDPTAHHSIKLRSWINYGEIAAALRRQGVCSYENISVDGTMNMSSQASLFSQFSLLFSVHSSQLVNLAFSHRMSATMEIQVNEGFGKHPNPRNWKREPHRDDPFSIWPSSFCSWHMCPGVFNASLMHGHSRDWRGASNYALNIPVFERDLALLLDRQRERLRKGGCPQVFKAPGDCPPEDG